MPFKKVGADSYTSPSGRHYNGAQVRLWHANGGKFPGEKGPGEMSKRTSGGVAHFAKGGAVIGRYSPFMKTPNEFSERSHGDGATDEVFGKGKSPGDEDQARGPANPRGKNKQVPPHNPR